MAISEIEKLERRYADNPQGLTFAPLAELYRKSGDVTRALELLAAGLERYPEYIPARIVLGRCHLDQDQVDEAEESFTRVLALDGENVIALKALADISERQGRYDVAQRWLHSLLSIDRNNDTAREHLARLEAARQEGEREAVPASAAAEPVVESATAPEPLSESAAAAEGVSAELPVTVEPLSEQASFADHENREERAPGGEIVAWVSETETRAEIADETAALVLDELAVPTDPLVRVEGVEVTEEVTLDAPPEPVAGLVRPDASTLPKELTEPDDDPFRVVTADDLVLRPSGASEFQMPDASQELVAAKPEPDPLAGVAPVDELAPAHEAHEAHDDVLATAPSSALAAPAAAPAPETAPQASPSLEILCPVDEAGAATAAEEHERDRTPATPVPASAAELQPEPKLEKPEPTPDAPAPDLIVTETMAEVLIQQGYTADALRIYRELERRNAGNERLRQRRAELEGRMRQSIAPPASYAARETGGRSVGVLFHDLLAARPAAPRSDAAPPPTAGSASAASNTAGAPTRPAVDTLSLSAVFGEESSPVPPAVPSGAKRDVSFDEFFGTSSGGPAAQAARAPAATEDDFEQFHAWLQNLKR